ncbi:LANO_0F11848g1_1 [Lachancea nothofagi CBS 11611]|uniref:LANO_0F11848g1_1 n=1 Tax=Lachancea nothofagi CBS 11611 TaxID=1266666 RepID=A0A1G4KB27_9SACH|nr:LANO_0F11848g1_1 [Lachancea nothofagi CBS 11611]
MTSSFLSIYSDSWTLSERPGSNLIKFEPSASDSGSSVLVDRLTGQSESGAPTTGSIGHVSPQSLKLLTSEVELEPMGDLASMSMAQRSLETLRRVEESMRLENVPVTPHLIMHRYAWDVEQYAKSQSQFPLDNVPIKCNILKTLFELLREYQDAEKQLPLENVAKVLHYLSKLIQASQLEVPSLDASQPLPKGRTVSLRSHTVSSASPSHSHTTSSQSVNQRHASVGHDASSPQYPSTRVSMHSGSGKSRIFSKFFAPAKSRESLHTRNTVHTRSTITVQPVGSSSNAANSTLPINSPSTGSTHDASTTALESVVSSHKIQDIEAMKTYKDSILALGKILKGLPQTDQNNIVFHFVDRSINPFILKDIHSLLKHYIQEEVIFRL